MADSNSTIRAAILPEQDTVQLLLDTKSVDDYRLFLKLKGLPRVRFQGRTALVPAEYARTLGVVTSDTIGDVGYEPEDFLFDYQRDIVRLALRKQRFAIFAEPGMGKTLMLLEYARHVLSLLPPHQCVLIVAPLMVVKQTIAEAKRFYGDSLPLEQVKARDLNNWLARGDGRIGITNFEAITDAVEPGRLGCLIIDESSCMKSSYGKWGQRLIYLGQGLRWKLALTGTPAPNDRIEYASHAVFLDREPTVNAFLARFFINRGQTDNRWELKPHALRPFYRALSDWCIFLNDPTVYGWKDNPASARPPIHVHIHDVELTEEQKALVSTAGGDMFGTPGGITSRAVLSQLAKGRYKGQKVETIKPAFIRDLIATWPEESTIVWCLYNHEQDTLERVLPDSVSIRGDTPQEAREQMIADFQAGRVKTLISKGSVLGFGLNLQIATRQVFSGLQDCYDDQTEILTPEGWKSFGQLAVGDPVATINPESKAFEWQNCSRVVWSPYRGPMLHFVGQRNFDLLVTPNHKLFVGRCAIRFPNGDSSMRLKRADEIAGRFRSKEYRMMSAPESYRGDRPETVSIPAYGDRQKWHNSRSVGEIPIEDFVRLAAWYITEGYCRPKNSPEFGRIVICQTDINKENRDEIISLLKGIGLSVNSNTKDITSYSRNLALFLMDQFGEGSANKRIPAWVKNLDRSLLVLLRDTMLKGDGLHNRRGEAARAYRTISRRLADDFQEIALKTGIRGSIRNRDMTGGLTFDVSLAWENIYPSIHTPPKWVDYNGMIGCVTVPNHAVIVRRNGIPVVSGNSFELYWQCVKRSNRIGSTRPLNVHIPITSVERKMVETVLSKAARVQADTEEQEKLFRETTLGI